MPEEVEVVRFGHNSARAIVFEVVEMPVFIHTYSDKRDFRWVEYDGLRFPLMELRAFAEIHQPIINPALSRDFAYVLWKILHCKPYETISCRTETPPSQMKSVRWPRKEDWGNFVMLTARLIIPQWKRIVDNPNLTSASFQELEGLMQEWAAKHGIRL